MLTVLQFINLMKHAIGRTPATGHDLYQTLNRAGRELTDRFEWSWKVATPVNLTVAAGDEGNNYIPLDSAHSFVGFKSLEAIESGGRMVTLVSPAQMLAIQERGLAYTDPTFCVVTDTLPASIGSTQPVPRLLLVDTLATGSAGTVVAKISYRRGWLNVAGSADDAKIIPLPDSFESALMYLCRAHAYALENENESPDRARYENAVQLLIGQDTTQQTYRGPMRGGAGDTEAYLDAGTNSKNWPRIVGGP